MTDEPLSSPASEVDSVSATSTCIRRLCAVALIALVIGLFVVFSKFRKPDDGGDSTVTSIGTLEVTAQLVEIRGEFLPNDDLYNYVFVMKYRIHQVHRGKIHSEEIFVAHYNPLKPRKSVADEFYPELGGRLGRFRAGDVHRMALDSPLDEYYIGGIVNRYHEEHQRSEQDQPVLLYLGMWTNPVIE